jgi:excisionase family DNA binding protein
LGSGRRAKQLKKAEPYQGSAQVRLKPMVEMLTTKEMQAMLQVDRSTIYRMAEAQQLPAIKVGKQWRFPADQVKSWLQQQAVTPKPGSPPLEAINGTADIGSLLPVEYVRLVQDTFAKALDAMVVVTDMTGNPVAEVSNPCGLFKVINQTPNAIQKCNENWSHLDTTPGLEPQFIQSRLGLLGARGLIRVGSELKGMVIVGGIAPADWPPAPDQVADAATAFGLPPEALNSRLHEVFYLDEVKKDLILSVVQRIADILAHTAVERLTLMGKLESIAQLVTSR